MVKSDLCACSLQLYAHTCETQEAAVRPLQLHMETGQLQGPAGVGAQAAQQDTKSPSERAFFFFF